VSVENAPGSEKAKRAKTAKFQVVFALSLSCFRFTMRCDLTLKMRPDKAALASA
jgi:hypothetical protein